MSNPFRTRQGPGAEDANTDLGLKLNEWLERSGPPGIFRTCASCRSMQRTGPAHCLKYNMVPPIDIIMVGCDSHDDECIPPLDANG
jgi:hypothetical protein